MLSAQQEHTLSGTVFDGENGEALIGATVYVDELRSGVAANEYGFYSLTIPIGTYHVIASYVGFQNDTLRVTISGDRKYDFALAMATAALEEVVVKGVAADHNVRSPEMSVSKLNVREIKAIPVLFGEQDVLKTIQLLPGVQSAGEGSTGFYVRGGDNGQNLILLDEAPVYNPAHLLGFFSIFNSDAINDIKLYKGGIPPEFGGRISSVLDVRTKEGNMKKFGVSGGLGLISSRLMLEGPIKKDVGSFILTGRRTYADLFLLFSRDTLIRNNTLYFYDFNLKANYKLGENDRLFLSGYFGRDVFRFQDQFGMDWGNATATLRWNHIFNNRLFLNTSLIFSNYNYVFEIDQETGGLDVRSAIKDINLKEDFQFYRNPRNTFKFGFKINYHNFIPGEITSKGDFQVNDTRLTPKHAIETAVYGSHKFQPFDWLWLVYGIRIPMYMMIGPGTEYVFDDDGNVTDSIDYNKGQNIARYLDLEPRISANFQLNTSSSIKVSYNRINQYIHLLSNTTSETPIDVWLPSSNAVKPEKADQVALGYFKNFDDNRWETSIEVYYKHMINQIDYKNGANIFFNELVESQLEFGSGRSYGAEFLVRKSYGKLHGWIGYTLARSERRFKNINGGQFYSAKQDRIHDISIVATYDLTDRWSLSGTWVYYTGNAVTFPSGKYQIEGKTVNMYTERNGYRMPPYHRLDVGATRTNKRHKRFESSWNFSIYNAYARKNAFTITFEEDENDATKTNAVRLSLFSIIPSVTYNFKF
jgi:hypothetical protein